MVYIHFFYLQKEVIKNRILFENIYFCKVGDTLEAKVKKPLFEQ